MKEFNDFWAKTLTEKERKSVLLEENSRFDKRKQQNGERQQWWDPSPCDRNSNYDEFCLTFRAIWGYDCGCCFNYNGCCGRCAWACYWHDKECITCTPWYLCGYACVPGCPNY